MSLNPHCMLSFRPGLVFSFFVPIPVSRFRNKSYSIWLDVSHTYKLLLLFFFITFSPLGSSPTYCHIALIVGPHPGSLIHICSKRKGLCCLQSIPSRLVKKGLWSEVVTSRWWTCVSRNKENHSLVATALSNLSHTVKLMLMPCELWSHKPKVHKTTLIQYISKSLHLTMRPSSTTQFFRLLCNFIKISCI